ncbi:MAG: hypothetical protein IBX69_05845 [Anaerolineales bacterium]|nr:hypothetical protein [Anaerolineales bacterium]
MKKNDWKISAKFELEQAEAARKLRNEGKARVCARRAAGHIVYAYLRDRYGYSGSMNAYNNIQYLTSLSMVPLKIRKVALLFLMRVTTNHNLPIDVDLIKEARWLAKELMGEEI